MRSEPVHPDDAEPFQTCPSLFQAPEQFFFEMNDIDLMPRLQAESARKTAFARKPFSKAARSTINCTFYKSSPLGATLKEYCASAERRHRGLAVLILVIGLACPCTAAQVSPGTSIPSLDLAGLMQPIPASAAFRDPGYFVWCGTMTQSSDGRYHLYYSRWKAELGMEAWVTSSEVAHAIGDSPFGPFKFHDVALPPRDNALWDGMVTHNPTILHIGKRYFLYYMGNTGNGTISPTINWVHRNNQRIGVAVASNPNGPWKRSKQPLVDTSVDASAPDALMVSNPSVTQGRDGRFYLLYKAVGRQAHLPFGGPVVHLMAISDKPAGPFKKSLKPLFTIAGQNFPFEDPFLWFDKTRDTYFVILKDNHGTVLGTNMSTLLLYQSSDATHWTQAIRPLVSPLELHWESGITEKVKRMERPQIAFNRDGKLIALIVAITDDESVTYNVRIPLSEH
jgi:hypothetical protein